MPLENNVSLSSYGYNLAETIGGFLLVIPPGFFKNAGQAPAKDADNFQDAAEGIAPRILPDAL